MITTQVQERPEPDTLDYLRPPERQKQIPCNSVTAGLNDLPCSYVCREKAVLSPQRGAYWIQGSQWGSEVVCGQTAGKAEGTGPSDRGPGPEAPNGQLMADTTTMDRANRQ